jgi:hypothetical protein
LSKANSASVENLMPCGATFAGAGAAEGFSGSGAAAATLATGASALRTTGSQGSTERAGVQSLLRTHRPVLELVVMLFP